MEKPGAAKHDNRIQKKAESADNLSEEQPCSSLLI